MSRDRLPQIASRSGRWFKRLGLTLSTAAVLSVFYSVYALVLRPLVDTPGMERRVVNTDSFLAPSRPSQGVEMAERYLASQPWAANAKYILRTDEAFVYFEEWDPLDEDEAVRFTPFAMVWTQKGRKPDEDPITIISDSAYVRFAKKFAVTSPNAGRVISAALEGAVRIQGDKGMQVVGRNFVFSEKQMRIWCETHVDFAYGPHKGNGHGLQIDLIADEAARAKEKLAVKGIKSLGLRRNVSMDLEFREGESGNLLAQNPPEEAPPFAGESPSAAPAKKPKEPTIVNVRSAGSFKFVVDTNVATFEDEVRVYQPTEPGKYNSLQSDLMTLYFEPKETASASKPEKIPATDAASEEAFQSVDSNLTFRRLVALGQNVILRSEANDLIAMMHHLDYDAKSRLAKMTSRKLVRVLQKQSEMQSPTIELLHQERGQVSNLWAKGAGWLQSLDEKTGKLAFAAQWKKELRKLPDPKTGLDWIELEGEVLVRQPEDKFGLAADFMRLWLDEERKPQASGPNLPATAPGEDSNRSSRMRLQKMLALNNVAIVSPEMQGQSQRLEVFFVPAPDSSLSAQETTAAKRSRDHLQVAVKQVPGQEISADTTRHPNVRAASQSRALPGVPLVPAPTEVSPTASVETKPGKSRESSTDSDSPLKKKTDGPIEVVSDVIQVKILTYPGGRESEVSEVRTEGHVQVRQIHAPDELPLHMTGERLHVLNRAKDDQLMTLWGSPAHVRDRGMHIEGREIFLDRENNLSRVNGSGLLQLPVKRSLDGEELKEPKLLDIWWTEEMTFDGLNAKFFGNVRAVLNNDGLRSNMRCEEMDVVLTNRISFKEKPNPQEADGGNAEIARVYCKDGVEFDSYKYEETLLTEVRRGRFGEFSVNQTTGDTTGQGPGWIKVWRRGRGKRAGLTPNASVKANRALKPDAAEWEYMRIDFAGSADGNLKQKFNTFKDRVKIIYGPVERSLMVIELDNLTKDAGWMACQNLRITQNEPAEKDQPGHVELLATGNVELEGRSFNARADSISFDESKGLYTLRSQGRRKATIWRQTQVGGEYSRADAQLMHFIPARNILKLDKAVGLDGVN